MKRALLLLAFAACDPDLEAGGSGVDAAVDEDPLAVDDDPAPGSWDQLHRDVIVPGCSSTPGLCHNGQFEPNLSTPSLAYYYLVNRPSIEKPGRYRAEPGNPDQSVLIDKLRGRGVATRMPLGADPLPEEEIAAIEAWIDDGALRRPDDDPPELLDEPPRMSEIGIYDQASGDRLDAGGTATIHVGQTIEIRHSVEDFETADADIPFGVVVLLGATGDAVLMPAAEVDPHIAPTAYDASSPEGQADLLNWQFTWTVPDTIELYSEATGERTPVPASGLMFTPAAVYVDQINDGIAAIAVSPRAVVVE